MVRVITSVPMVNTDDLPDHAAMLFNQSQSRERFSLYKYRRSMILFLLWFSPVILPSLWFGYKHIESHFTEPKAVFVLGGAEEREVFAAQFAQQHQLPIWVSSGSPKGYVEKIFAKAGIERDRLHLDYRAVDTVTNFTTLVAELKAKGINSVYLITSDNHMRRARVIGDIVFGSRGIALKPISVDSGKQPESIRKCLRDASRAVLWLTTGYTGEDLAYLIRKYR